MGPSEERIRDHLVTDEPLNVTAAGTLIDNSSREYVSIGLTDRRILGCAEDGGFVDIGYGAICSIRSQVVSRLSVQSEDYRFLTAGGGPLAMVAAIALILYLTRLEPASNAVTIGLSIATVVGISTAVFVKRQHDANMADRRSLIAGMIAGLIALFAFGGLIVVSVGVLGPVLVIVTVVGLAMADYARRHRAEFGDFEITSIREKAITVNTVDGRSVRLLVDSTSEVDHRLSRLASSSPTGQSRTIHPGASGEVRLRRTGVGDPETDEVA